MKFKVTPFSMPDGAELKLYVATGEVLEESRHEVVKVHQDASTVLPQSRGDLAVIPGRIRSSTEQRQSLWLRDAEGREENVRLDAVAPLAVRSGHRVSLAYVSSEQTEGSMWLAAARNHQTGELRRAPSDMLFGDVLPQPMARYKGSWLLWGLLAGCLLLGLIAFGRGTDANNTIQRVDISRRFARCEAPAMWWTKVQYGERNACLARLKSADYRKQLADSEQRGWEAEKVVAQSITMAWSVVIAIPLVLCAMGLRRSFYARQVRERFEESLEGVLRSDLKEARAA